MLGHILTTIMCIQLLHILHMHSLTLVPQCRTFHPVKSFSLFIRHTSLVSTYVLSVGVLVHEHMKVRLESFTICAHALTRHNLGGIPTHGEQVAAYK